MKAHAYVITAPDGSVGIWSTNGFRRIPAPKTTDPDALELAALGFPLDEVAPLVEKAKAAGVTRSADIRRYIMRNLMP
jgi:hypothetical protein